LRLLLELRLLLLLRLTPAGNVARRTRRWIAENRTELSHGIERRQAQKRTARRRSDEPGSTPYRNDRHPGPKLSTLARPAIMQFFG
jgi:hypothetical protein